MHMRVPGLVAPCGILEQSAYDVSRTLRHFQPLSDTPEAMPRTRRGARGMAARVAATPIRGSRSTGPPTQSVPAAAPVCGRRSTRQSSGTLAREASTTVVASMTLEQLMEVVGTCVRQEMQAQSSAPVQLGEVTAPVTTSEL